MIIPCKECIRYAICKPKKNVECNPLTEFFNTMNAKRNRTRIEKRINKGLKPLPKTLCSSEKNKAWNETWSIIRQDLPNLKGIYTETITSQYTGISGKVVYGRVSY